MKLLMITGLGSVNDLVSDKKGAFYNTLEEFHKHWERIDIISPRVKGHGSGVKIFFGNVYIHISPWPLMFHPVWFVKKGIEIYKEQKFNLMTVHEFPPFYNGIGARLLWQNIRVPYILEILHIPGHPTPADSKEKIYKNLMKWFIRFDSSKARAVRVMNPVRSLARASGASPQDLGKATSNGMNNTSIPEFLIKAGVPENKIIHIPAIYVDLDIFRPMTDDQRPITKKYDLIFVGRLAENKGINLFLETVKKLNCKAIIVGTGPLAESLKFKIKSLKLEDKIIFHGWAKDSSEISQLINESKILVMPSYNEGGPRVVVEAMACGVPVLATPVGIVPDVIDEAGILIDWDADDIAKKAKQILENYETYRNSGLETAKQFERKEAIKNYAEELKKFIND